MGATEIDVALRDGGHADLVIGSAEKCSKGAGKHHITVSDSTTNRHAHLQERKRGGVRAMR